MKQNKEKHPNKSISAVSTALSFSILLLVLSVVFLVRGI